MEKKRKQGFTLIELLVVIAIIALILSFVLPTLNTGHPHPPQRLCRIHLRQLDIGLLLYHEENEVWIDKKSWCDLLEPYLGDGYRDVFLCPEDKTGPCSYAMNENIPAGANELPGDMVLLFESAPGWNQTGGAATNAPALTSPSPTAMSNSFLQRIFPICDGRWTNKSVERKRFIVLAGN
ncbi:MAG: type II secretion system protein [Planctomycetota bacterium]|jgi:prepilin-type N-terminal cleavage/methylation domain-containing protein